MKFWILNAVYCRQFGCWNSDIAIFPREVKIPIVPLFADLNGTNNTVLFSFVDID